MKTIKIKEILMGLMVMMAAASCSDSFLDKDGDDQKSEEDVFTRYEEVNKLVSHAYARSKAANRPLVWLNHFSSSAITDECEGNNAEGNITNLYNQGAWNPSSNFPGNEKQFWNSIYESIRHINTTLEGISKYNTPDNPMSPGDLEKRIGELYFLRGYLHWVLMREYGEIPYLDYAVDPNATMDFKRESVHAVTEKIITDARTAYEKVQDVYSRSDENFGRIDKGACLGLIAEARWIAATPMWNGAKEKYGYTGTREHEEEYGYSAERWKAAAQAAKEVMDLTINGKKRYSLYTKYTDTNFEDDGGRNLNGSLVYTRLWDMYHDYDAFADEAVFFVTRDKDQGWQGDIYPPSRGGSARQQPVQEQVDEYEYMAPDGFGYPVYSEEARRNGYDDGNPYQHRDPRFYRDIIYHGAPTRDNNNNARTMNTAEGPDKIGASSATTTGYYFRKFIKEGWNKSGGIQFNCPPIWRLPEIIYIYAEGINETEGPNEEIYNLINQVRARSFMSPMPPAVKNDAKLMREYIHRERRVEMFYENKRVWDCRLYLEPSSSEELAKEQKFKEAGSDNTERSQNYWKNNLGAYPKCQRMINGMRPVEDPDGAIEADGKRYRMERFCIEERIFEVPKHYLWPLLDSEIQVCPTLQQNPGW